MYSSCAYFIKDFTENAQKSPAAAKILVWVNYFEAIATLSNLFIVLDNAPFPASERTVTGVTS